jgi:hypothetical protein
VFILCLFNVNISAACIYMGLGAVLYDISTIPLHTYLIHNSLSKGGQQVFNDQRYMTKISIPLS